MALVDYTSEEDSQDDDDQTTASATGKPKPKPPPLPRAFHNLYAATVRAAPADHPSLHDGRRRAIPHVAGQWPSHLYIEWIPSPVEYERLDALLSALRDRIDMGSGGGGDGGDGGGAAAAAAGVHSLLTSDLAVPLPLHISLSRPFVLQTAEKAGFLRQLTASIKSAGVSQFAVVFSDLFWYRGPDSARAFLVLRAEVEGCGSDGGSALRTCNRPLVALLDRCNAQVTAAGQPALYSGGPTSAARSFHVSVAWTLAGIEAWGDATRQVYEQWSGRKQDEGEDAGEDEDEVLRMHVESIKAKIGNVVTDIPLAKTTPSVASGTAGPGRKRLREEGDDYDDTNGSKKSGKSNDTRRRGKSLFGL